MNTKKLATVVAVFLVFLTGLFGPVKAQNSNASAKTQTASAPDKDQDVKLTKIPSLPNLPPYQGGDAVYNRAYFKSYRVGFFNKRIWKYEIVIYTKDPEEKAKEFYARTLPRYGWTLPSKVFENDWKRGETQLKVEVGAASHPTYRTYISLDYFWGEPGFDKMPPPPMPKSL